MEVKVTKLTTIDLMQKACGFTTGKDSGVSLDDIYRCEHSPLRTQIFWIELLNIPTYVSVHLVRHKFGVEHFVKSNRGNTEVVDRNTPVNHSMLINAQALINMARKRLCNKADIKTKEVMLAIKKEIVCVDADLYNYLVPECIYRGKCVELKPCSINNMEEK